MTNKVVLDKLVKSIEEYCINIISKNYRYLFDEKLFFDSNYHLNGKAIPARTEYLIGDLKNFLAKKG